MRKNRRPLPLLFLCLLTAASCLLSGCSGNEDKQITEEIANRISNQYSKEQVLDFFGTVALQAEYSSEELEPSENEAGDAVSYTHPLARWETDTIYYTIDGSKNAPDTTTIVQQVIGNLNAIPNLPDILPADESHTASLTISIGTQEAIQYMMQMESDGFNTFSYDLQDYHVTKGKVYLYAMELSENNLPMDSDMTMHLTEDRIKHIVTEEITQTMGLPNDCTGYPESVLDDDANEATSLSNLDTMILVMMYSKDFKSGMSYDETMQRADTYLMDTVYTN